MATQLGIVNGALNELGQQAVSNVENDANATLLDEKVELTYKRKLTDTNWTFSQKYASLVLTTDEGIPNFPFVFQLPSDFERLVNVDRITNYRILQDKIYVS